MKLRPYSPGRNKSLPYNKKKYTFALKNIIILYFKVWSSNGANEYKSYIRVEPSDIEPMVLPVFSVGREKI